MKSRELVRLYLDLLAPQRKMLAVAIVFAALKSIAETPVPRAIGYVVDRVAAGDLAWFAERQWWLLGAIAGYAVLYAPILYWRGVAAQLVAFRAFLMLRVRLFNHIQGLSADFFVRHRTGDLTARLIADIQVVSNTVVSLATRLAFDLFMALPSLYFMFTASVPLSVLVLLFAAWQLGFTAWMVPGIRRRSKSISEKLGEISSDATEKIEGNALIRALAEEEQAAARFHTLNREHYHLNTDLMRYSNRRYAIVEPTVVVFPLVLVIAGAMLARHTRVTPGEIVAIVMYMPMITGALQRATESLGQWSQALGSMERVQEIFGTFPRVADRPAATAMARPAGALTFDRVSFAYPALGEEPRRPVIHDFSLAIRPGESVALVGPSGSGKTTLSQLLLRFYDVDEGTISIDGHDIRQVTQASLRRAVGIVMQRTIIFSGTIRDNLRLVRPSATDAEIWKALEFASLADYVRSLSAGLDSLLGERGMNLSGGQQQRLSIARVFLKDPAVLVLDEATSALDARSEAVIQAEFERLMAGRTCLIIAHRLSTIRRADRIVVLAQGRIAEIGTHEELMARQGAYCDLIRTQTGDRLA